MHQFSKTSPTPHRAVQRAILSLFGAACELEFAMPAIGRIADCAIASRRLVFEIQCSAISPEEAEERTADYKSLGWHVVWILHDKLYNRFRLTALEKALYAIPHYYTNISATAEGPRGIFYTQYCYIQSHYRFFRKPLVSIDLRKIDPRAFRSQFFFKPSLIKQKKRYSVKPFIFGIHIPKIKR